MNLDQLAKANKQATYVEELIAKKVRFADEWDRLTAMRGKLLLPGQTVDINVAVGDKWSSQHSDEGTRYKMTTFPMTRHVYNLIMKQMDLEIVEARIKLEEMGVDS